MSFASNPASSLIDQSSQGSNPLPALSKSASNNKKFFPPTQHEEMFIDHDCTLDNEGYPLYPNLNTVFVKTADMEVTNFGEVGFPKTVGVEFRAKRTWKVT
jgi:hypothetical protein